MEISENQTEQIKQQLIQQIDSTFPEEKKESAKQQVNSMGTEQLKEFLKQNNLVKSPGDSSQTQQCIFCSIISGNIPSTKIGENNEAIAILEINPVSKGHSIIIPKEHLEKKEDLPDEALQLAKEIAEKLKVLNPKKIELIPANIFGHEIINVLPVYTDETLTSEKHSAKKEDLENLKEQLENPPKKEEPEEEPKKQEKEINEKNTWLPKRIP